MNKLGKKLLASAMTVAMAATTLAGCGGTSQLAESGDDGSGSAASGSSAESSSGDETITLTVFSQLANYSGEQVGWIADILKDKFGVVLNIVPDLNGTLQTRMENGNLGDIVVWGDNGSDYQAAIDAGLLYDWNEDDLLQEYGQDVLKYFPNALDFNASYSGGTTYGIGHGLASGDGLQTFMYSWDIRWDLYAQLGYPEVKDLDDLVDLFEKMKEICPTDENGNPTYAASLWPDWDGTYVMYVKATATAYYGYDELGVGHYDPDTGDYYDCLADDSPYYKMLKFYNTLYQKNLLDPDSMTATYDTMKEKMQAGGVFFSIFDYAGRDLYNTDENLAAGKAMLSLRPEEASPIVYGLSTLGGNRLWTIGSKTAYPEKCMEIINWLCTPEGYETMQVGPKGVTWDYDSEGYPYLTEFGQKTAKDIETKMDEAGYSGTFHDGQLQINNITWSLDAPNPDAAEGETFNWRNWMTTLEDTKADIEQDWNDHTGYKTRNEYFLDGNYKVSPISTYVVSTRDPEFDTKWTQTTTAITTYSWQAIYAKDDAEFESLWKTMQDEAKSYYYDECVAWSQNEAAIRYEAEQQLK